MKPLARFAYVSTLLVLVFQQPQISAAKYSIFPPPELTPPNPEGLAPIPQPYFSSTGCIDRDEHHTATFAEFNDELEQKKKPGNRSDLPRGLHRKAYAGCEWWNARAGTNVTQAVRAMLGDPFAHYASPLFLLYKMVALNQTQYLPNFIYHESKGHWPAINASWPDFLRPLIFETLPAVKASNLTRDFMGRSEVEAVCAAKWRMDDRFSRMTRAQLNNLYFAHIGAMLGEDPYDALYTTVYQYIASAYYGSQVIVIAPDSKRRSLDLNFYQRRWCPDWRDYGEVLTPGYIEPERILGYHLANNDQRQPSKTRPGPGKVEYAFYRVREYGESYALLLSPLEMDHSVYCIDQLPEGRFVECDFLTSYYDDYDPNSCSAETGLPFPVPTNVSIPVVGIVYKAKSSAVPGSYDEAMRRKKARAVLEKYRSGGPTSNQTLRFPLPPKWRRIVENASSTDRTSFVTALWTVDMVELDDVAPQEEANHPLPEPPLLIIALLSIASVGGDLLGQRATRRHYKSTRRMILVSMVVSALLVLALGGSAQILLPKQTGRLVIKGRKVQCYQEALSHSPSAGTQAFCEDRPFACTPADCPAQGPFSLTNFVRAQPLLLLLGLLAIVYHVCEVILHLHPMGVLFKPLAAFLATYIIIPLAAAFGYNERPIPALVVTAGALGTCLCLHDGAGARAREAEVELTSPRGRSLGTGTILATTTVGDNLPVSEHWHENEDGREIRITRDQMKVHKTRGYHSVESWDTVGDADNSSDEDETLLGTVSETDSEGLFHTRPASPTCGGTSRRHISTGPFVNMVLLPLVFAVLVACLAAWVVAQKLVNDRCWMNEFGFTSLEVVMPLYMGGFLWVCDVLPSGVRQAFLPDMHDQEQSLLQASRQAWVQSFDHSGEALLLVTVQRVLAIARIVVYFWLSVNYNLTSVFFESTILRIAVSWVSVIVINGSVPGFIDLDEAKERLSFRDKQSQKMILVKGLGTLVVFLTLLYLQLQP